MKLFEDHRRTHHQRRTVDQIHHPGQRTQMQQDFILLKHLNRRHVGLQNGTQTHLLCHFKVMRF
ncbi:hypothetical protein D3C80_1758030 [compost metagenome]